MENEVKTGGQPKPDPNFEKIDNVLISTASPEPEDKDRLTEGEVFKKGADGVDFRTVGWKRASMIFLKVVFATGVLNIPGTFVTLGAVGGTLACAGWVALNTYLGVILGDFQVKHFSCHNISDMAGVVGGPILRELTGVLFVIAFIMASGSGILGVSIAFNALSDHSICTVWFSLFATIIVASAASFRKLEKIGILTWIGFASIIIAVFIVVIAVTQRDRPFAAPQTGPFDMGFHVIYNGGFSASISANAILFISSAGEIAFVPVISEMRDPRDFQKALYSCMGLVGALYVALSLVVYKWCGQWVTSPSLGSAGGLIKKVSYGIALIGLVVSGCIYLHLCAKYVFVRILRKSKHLQANTFTHWATWLAAVWALAAVALAFSEGIPVYSWMAAIAGAVCFAPLSIMLPAYLWVYDHTEYRTGTMKQKAIYAFHWLIFALGVFMCVGGTYATADQIHTTYLSNHNYGQAFSCADNSGTVV